MFKWSNFVKVFQNYWLELIKGALSTIALAIIGTLVGLVLGLLLALLRNLKAHASDNIFIKIIKKFFSILSICYIEFFRGTPMMVQALIFFFGVSSLGANWPYFVYGAFVISLNTAAYMAEIIRSGINSVDKGQFEAASSLGMNNFQTMFLVVFPQALKNAIPTIGNEFIVNIKDSSVLNVITVTELFMIGKMAANNTYIFMETYIIISLFYLIMTLSVSLLLRLLEKKLNKGYVEENKKMPTRNGIFNNGKASD